MEDISMDNGHLGPYRSWKWLGPPSMVLWGRVIYRRSDYQGVGSVECRNLSPAAADLLTLLGPMDWKDGMIVETRRKKYNQIGKDNSIRKPEGREPCQWVPFSSDSRAKKRMVRSWELIRQGRYLGAILQFLGTTQAAKPLGQSWGKRGVWAQIA